MCRQATNVPSICSSSNTSARCSGWLPASFVIRVRLTMGAGSVYHKAYRALPTFRGDGVLHVDLSHRHQLREIIWPAPVVASSRRVTCCRGR